MLSVQSTANPMSLPSRCAVAGPLNIEREHNAPRECFTKGSETRAANLG